MQALLSQLTEDSRWLIPLGGVGLVVVWVIRAARPLLTWSRVIAFSGMLLAAGITLSSVFLSPKQGEWLQLAASLTGVGLSGWWMSKVIDRWAQTSAGGIVLGIMLGEGSSAERKSLARGEVNLSSLRQWRERGHAGKAYLAAKRRLVEIPAAFPVWLFAMETAAVSCGRCRDAERILWKFCRSHAFSRDQKVFAVNSLDEWARAQGYPFSVERALAIVTRKPWWRQLLPKGPWATSKSAPVVDTKRGDADNSRVTLAGLAADEAYQVCQRLLQEGYFGQAVATLEEWLAENPDDIRCATLLLHIWLDKLGDLHPAETLLERMLGNPQLDEEQRQALINRLRVAQRRVYSGETTGERLVLRMTDEFKQGAPDRAEPPPPKFGESSSCS